MKKAILLISLLFYVLLSGAQEAIIKGEFDNFYIDALGNFYTVKDNTVQKYNAKGDKTEIYTSFINGNISWLDVSNPLKTLIYYQNFDQVIFLDKYLSVRSKTIDLAEHGIISSRAAAISYDNGIWVYDQSALKILRLDHSLAITHESGTLTIDTYAQIQFIHQSNEKVLLAFSRNLFIFDRFGSFDKAIPLPQHQALTWAGDFIFYISDKQLFRYNLSNHKVKAIDWPHESTKNIRYNQKKLYYQNKKGIFCASI